MRELAARHPGRVVHVTPENIDKLPRDPMLGDVVFDEWSEVTQEMWNAALTNGNGKVRNGSD